MAVALSISPVATVTRQSPYLEAETSGPTQLENRAWPEGTVSLRYKLVDVQSGELPMLGKRSDGALQFEIAFAVTEGAYY